jgi:hypothetical protein
MTWVWGRRPSGARAAALAFDYGLIRARSGPADRGEARRGHQFVFLFDEIAGLGALGEEGLPFRVGLHRRAFLARSAASS